MGDCLMRQHADLNCIICLTWSWTKHISLAMSLKYQPVATPGTLWNLGHVHLLVVDAAQATSTHNRDYANVTHIMCHWSHLFHWWNIFASSPCTVWEACIPWFFIWLDGAVYNMPYHLNLIILLDLWVEDWWTLWHWVDCSSFWCAARGFGCHY